MSNEQRVKREEKRKGTVLGSRRMTMESKSARERLPECWFLAEDSVKQKGSCDSPPEDEYCTHSRGGTVSTAAPQSSDNSITPHNQEIDSTPPPPPINYAHP